MDFSDPIAGELGEDDELVGAADAILERLDAMLAMQREHMQALGLLAQQMQMIGAARRVVRDDTGRVIGSELA